MMQVTADQIVRVVAVGYSFVTAIGAVLMPGLMIAAGMIGRAGVRVAVRYLHRMVVIMSFMGAVHVPIMQVVGMITVLDRGMAASGTMDMVVIAMMVMMLVLVSHCYFSWL